MIYALDTNTLIYYFKGMGRVAERMKAVPPNSIAIPTVVLFELYVNLIKSQNSDGRVRLLREFAERSIILPLGREAAVCAASVRARLEQKGQPIGPLDTLIAGTAIAARATLVTRNLREFSKAEGLSVEDWY